jgi:hypothetical protein
MASTLFSQGVTMLAFASRPVRFHSLQTLFLVLASCGFVEMTGIADEPKGIRSIPPPVLRAPLDNDWKIEIAPGPAIGPSPAPKAEMAARQAIQSLANPASTEPASGIVLAGAESALPPDITPAAYLEVYNSIPFRRSEYLANRSYRHVATIEILLGQVRPKTVVNVIAPPTTCCSPFPATLVRWFNSWDRIAFDYRNSRYRP